MLFRSDRKSTRLNSSHTIISYAVFCLKKKQTYATLCVLTSAVSMWSDAVADAAPAHLTDAPAARPRQPDHLACPHLFLFFLKKPGPPGIHPFPPPRPLPV